MSKFGKALAAFAVVAALGASQAQAQSRFVIGGGSTLGLSDIKQSANGGFSNGPHILVGYEWLDKSGFGIRLDGMYHRITGDDQTFGTTTGLSNRLRVLNATADAVYAFKTASSFKPYLIAGVGYYGYKAVGAYADSVAASGTPVSSQNKFGFNVGAGFEGGKKLIYFGEARFHRIGADSTVGFKPKVLPITVGVKIPFGAK